MLDRINIWEIVRNHLKTLRSLNQSGKGIYIADLFLFFIFPIIASAILVYKKIDLSPKISDLIAAISILGGFLFNLLAIIYGAMDKLKVDAESSKAKLKKVFIKEIHTNISFCILLSILSVIFLILYSYDFPLSEYFQLYKRALLLVNYFLLFLFLLTLLMVLKRIYILLKKDADESDNPTTLN